MYLWAETVTSWNSLVSTCAEPVASIPGIRLMGVRRTSLECLLFVFRLHTHVEVGKTNEILYYYYFISKIKCTILVAVLKKVSEVRGDCNLD